MRTLPTLPLLLLALNAPAQWELVTPIKTVSEFDAIQLVSDNVGFAVDRNRGAILRTHDGGVHWDRLVTGLTNSPMALFMWDDQRGIAVGESGSTYRTENAFTTTVGSNNPIYGHASCVFFINDTLGWMGTESGRIYRSTDSGATWALMQSGQGSSNYMTAIQFLDTQVGYASCAGGGKVLKSTDSGLTWQNIGPMDQLVLVRDLHFYDELLGVGVGSAGEVIRTTDGGVTWDSIPSNTTYTMMDLSVQGDTMVACGWWGRTIRSTDGGLTWTELQVGFIEHQSLSIRPSGIGLMGTNGRIMRTHDFGQTWAVVHTGTIAATLNKMSFANNDTGVVAGWTETGALESGMLRTVDGGMHWTASPGGGGLGVHLTQEGHGCRGGSVGSFARTSDFFTTSQPINGPNVAIRCTWSFDANTHLVAGGYVNGGIYRTTNGGMAWTNVLGFNNSIFDLWFVNDLVGFAVGEGGLSFKSTDGGITWEPLGVPSAGDLFTVFFLNEQLGWTSNSRTTDGGETWEIMNGIPGFCKSIFFTDPDTGYAVGNNGMTVRSVDGGATWEFFLPQLLNVMINDAAWVDGNIVIGGTNGDIYVARVSCPATVTVPVITRIGNTLCATGDGTAQWFLDGELLSDDALCIEAVIPGSYHVIVTDALGCVSAQSAPVQVISTGIVERAMHDRMRLVPNPASDVVRMERTEATPVLLRLFDAQGAVVREQWITGHTATVDLSGLRSGLYIARAGNDAVRLVKE